MSNDIALVPRTGNPSDWTAQQAALVEFAGLAKVVNTPQGPSKTWAPRPVVEAFLAACHRTQLHPIARQIYCIELGGKYTVMVSIDGLRVVAQRTNRYRGALPTEWTADGVTWVPVWLDKASPAAARVRVVHADFDQPIDGIATWAEFGKTTSTWKAMPAHMLAKVAESLALRRAFPMELSGLYTPEEIDRAEVIEPSADWVEQIKSTDDKADLAALDKQIKDAGEWTPNLGAEIGAHAATLTKDSRPPREGAPGQTGDPTLDSSAHVVVVKEPRDEPTEEEYEAASAAEYAAAQEATA